MSFINNPVTERAFQIIQKRRQFETNDALWVSYFNKWAVYLVIYENLIQIQQCRKFQLKTLVKNN